MKKIMVIRTRGKIRLWHEVGDTLSMLNLHKINYGTVVEDKKEIMGMITRAKDYIIWGEVSEELAAKHKGKFFRIPHLAEIKGKRTGKKQNMEKVIAAVHKKPAPKK